LDRQKRFISDKACSCRHPLLKQRTAVNNSWGSPVKALMPTLMVVKLRILPKSLTSLTYRLISLQIHLLVLYTSPEPLDKDIIHPPTPARKVQAI